MYALIVGRDPRQLSFEFALWTREMVRQVIRREFNVAMSAVSVGRLLRTMGLSPQWPLRRAYQQNPGAVWRWKHAEFPAIRAAAKSEGATIYFTDEAGGIRRCQMVCVRDDLRELIGVHSDRDRGEPFAG